MADATTKAAATTSTTTQVITSGGQQVPAIVDVALVTRATIDAQGTLPSITTPPSVNETPKITTKKQNFLYIWIIVGVSLFCLVFVLILFVLVVKFKKRNRADKKISTAFINDRGTFGYPEFEHYSSKNGDIGLENSKSTKEELRSSIRRPEKQTEPKSLRWLDMTPYLDSAWVGGWDTYYKEVDRRYGPLSSPSDKNNNPNTRNSANTKAILGQLYPGKHDSDCTPENKLDRNGNYLSGEQMDRFSEFQVEKPANRDIYPRKEGLRNSDATGSHTNSNGDRTKGFGEVVGRYYPPEFEFEIPRPRTPIRLSPHREQEGHSHRKREHETTRVEPFDRITKL